MAAKKPSKAQLDKYHAKRDFKKTAEPRGVVKQARSRQLTYMIQKHAATRLHFDFRLEWNGVLKSWAVTRGPSYDPGEKRLAVHVEDHPLGYATFEGTIPKGEYGGGTVMLWDQGYWEPLDDDVGKALAKGRLNFRLHGKRLKGDWHLVRMGHDRNARPGATPRDNWLLIKSHDDFADRSDPTATFTTSVTTKRSLEQIAKGKNVWRSNRAAKSEPVAKPAARKTVSKVSTGKKAKLPKFVEVELATLVDEPPTGDNWVHEFKFDGYRALARIDGNAIKLITRAENDWTEKFLDLPKQLKVIKVKNALIDGEVVAPDADGAMTFHALQNILGRNGNKKNHGKGELHYYAFDLLHLNGEDLRHLPLLERKARLRKIIPARHARIHYSDHFDAPGAEVLANVCSLKMEGIISKRSDAPYRSGRGKDWLKSKCINEQEFVIVGYTHQTEHPGQLGALLIGHYNGDDLLFAGKVGTGFTQDEARDLLKRFEKLSLDKHTIKAVPSAYRRTAHWIKPTLVAQIKFGEWTPDGMLRHASYQGLREDKPARSVKREVATHEKAASSKPVKKSAPVKSGKPAVTVSGITLSHPDKILYPNDKITKADIADYYARVGDLMLPHVKDYPISLMRCNDGIGPSCFFQRHDESDAEFIKHVTIDLNGTARDFMVIQKPEALIGLAQLNVLEVHAWGAKAKTPDRPDKIVFDFDPDPAVPFARVKDAALEMRDRLQQIKLESFLKTTGGKGLHVVVPIVPGPDWDTVKDFSRAMAELMVEDSPKLYLANMNKAKRKGKIYIDYQRNGKSASAVAPYSTRARDGAPIAMPMAWADLKKLTAANLVTIKNFPKNFTDPWQDFSKLKQKLKFSS